MYVILGWLVQNTLVVALLVPVVLLLGRLWRFRPANQHLLWLLLLVKLLTPPLVNWPLPGGWSRSDEAGPVAVAAPVEAVMIAAPIDDVPTDVLLPAFGSPSDMLPVETPVVEIAPTLPVRAAIDNAQLLPLAFASAWLIGSAAVSLWLTRQLLRQVAILRHAKPPTQGLQQWVGAAARLQNLRGVRVRISDVVASPFISCLGRPTLVWPAAMAGGELERFQAVLAHELAHLARRDHWTMWLELVAMQLLWFNPLVWYLRRRLEETRELACDALALESAEIDRGGFAELLLSLSSPNRLSLSSTAPLAAGIGSAFHRRLAMLFCDRASGRISLAGLLVAGLFAAAALPGWAQSTTDPKSKPPESAPAETAAAPVAEVKPASEKSTAAGDDHHAANAAREGTIGEVKEIKDDVLLVQLKERRVLPKDTPLFVIRITPTHSEMVGQLRVMKTDDREVVAKLQPQVAKPQVGDFVWPAGRIAEPRATGVGVYGRSSATTPPAIPTTPSPTTQPIPPVGTPPVLLPRAQNTPAPVAGPPLYSTPSTTTTRSTRYVTMAVDDSGTVFRLEDGSKIIARLGEDGSLHMFLEKDGKRQELSNDKESTRPGRSPTPRLPGGSSGTSTAPLSRTSTVPPTPYPSPMPMPIPTLQAAPPRELALQESNLELAKLEVEEKQILLSQAAERAKKGEVSDLEVKLKEVELRKAQIRLKQVQLQFDESKPSTSSLPR